MKKSLKILIFLSSLFFLIIVFFSSFYLVEKNSKLNINDSLKNVNLISHQGLDIKNLKLNDFPILMFFGFTHCPEVCPTTLNKLENIISDVNTNNKKIKIIFVTLDPERDTVQNLNDYLQQFDELVIGLTGKIDEIRKFAKKWNIYWEKIYYDNNDYNINHTASVFMINEKGNFIGTIAWGENMESSRLKIKNLIKN